MYVCLCNAVTEGALREAARAGACTRSELMRKTRAGTGCGMCVPDIDRIAKDERAKSDVLPLAAK